VFEIPNHNPISTPSQVRKSKKSRKTSKRLLKKVYTCIMILLTTQTKEKKMKKSALNLHCTEIYICCMLAKLGAFEFNQILSENVCEIYGIIKGDKENA
jgi:hypothetical protein